MSPPRMQDPTLDAHLRYALRTLGYMPGQNEWAERKLRPHFNTLRRRFGNWAAVQAYAAGLVVEAANEQGHP